MKKNLIIAITALVALLPLSSNAWEMVGKDPYRGCGDAFASRTPVSIAQVMSYTGNGSTPPCYYVAFFVTSNERYIVKINNIDQPKMKDLIEQIKQAYAANKKVKWFYNTSRDGSTTRVNWQAYYNYIWEIYNGDAVEIAFQN